KPGQGSAPATAPTDPLPGYALKPDGSYYSDPLTGAGTHYVSENWGRPMGCVPRAADGTPLTNNPADPYFQDVAAPGGACIEAPLTGVAFGIGTDNAATHPAQTVDGNYTLPPANPGAWGGQMG